MVATTRLYCLYSDWPSEESTVCGIQRACFSETRLRPATQPRFLYPAAHAHNFQSVRAARRSPRYTEVADVGRVVNASRTMVAPGRLSFQRLQGSRRGKSLAKARAATQLPPASLRTPTHPCRDTHSPCAIISRLPPPVPWSFHTPRARLSILRFQDMI